MAWQNRSRAAPPQQATTPRAVISMEKLFLECIGLLTDILNCIATILKYAVIGMGLIVAAPFVVALIIEPSWSNPIAIPLASVPVALVFTGIAIPLEMLWQAWTRRREARRRQRRFEHDAKHGIAAARRNPAL
jgi:hypothetical protein